jgi:hypothetical protein
VENFLKDIIIFLFILKKRDTYAQNYGSLLFAYAFFLYPFIITYCDIKNKPLK